MPITPLLSSLLAAATLLAPSTPQGPAPKPGSALRIDGVEVPVAEYGRWLIETQASKLAKTFAEDFVVLGEAERRGLSVPDDEVIGELRDEVRRRIEGAFKGERAGWVDEVERTGATVVGYENRRFSELEPVLAATAMVAEGRVVPEDKIVRDWELVYGPRGRDLDILMMKFQVEVLTPPEGAPAGQQERNKQIAWEEQRQRALAIRARILAGEDFGTLAAEYSDDPDTRAGRGRLGRPFRRGGWSHAFIDALLELEDGEVSEPLFARGGWWLVKVLGIKDTTLEEARPAMIERLLAKGPEQDEVGRLWIELTENIEFELNPEIFDPNFRLEEGAPEPVALVVEGQPVTLSEYAEWLLVRRGEELARHFAEQWLVERKAREMGIEVSTEQIDERVAEYVEWMINTGHQGSRESWMMYLKLSGRDSEHFMRELRDKKRVELLVQELIFRERKVSPDQVRRRWEQLYGERGRALKVRVILCDVRMPEMTQELSREELQAVITRQVDAARARAEEVRLRALDGEGFAALAERFSDDPVSRASGGTLPGHFQPEGWAEELARDVMRLEVGAISEPLWTGRAWAVFEVLGTESRPFEEARAEIEEQLRTAKPSGAEIAYYRNGLVSAVELEVLPGMNE